MRELNPVNTMVLPTESAFQSAANAVLSVGNHCPETVGTISLCDVPILDRLRSCMEQGEKAVFIIPAFPAKSANPLKTSGPLPDLGEVVALQTLDRMCEEIALVHPAGAEVWICSDGRVFNDLVLVDDAALLAYMESIKSIIEEFGLKHLRHFSLEDRFGDVSFAEMRESLVVRYGESLESIRERVIGDPESRFLFNGLHRFIKEDRARLTPNVSRNAFERSCKDVAYRVMQRSGAWDRLLEEVFPDALRLSIHPYPVEHRKFGVKLVPGSDRWATPWHNVVLKTPEGLQLVRRSEAEKLGAQRDAFRGKYAYFRI